MTAAFYGPRLPQAACLSVVQTAQRRKQPRIRQSGWYGAIRLSDGTTLLATTSYDQTVRLWDPTTAASVGVYCC